MKRGSLPKYSLYAESSHVSDAVDMNAFCTMDPSLYMDQRGWLSLNQYWPEVGQTSN
jgi:hypothetical protein